MRRLRKVLAGLPDLERGVTRILHKTASPSELLTILKAFASLASLLKLQVLCNAQIPAMYQSHRHEAFAQG